LLYQSKVRRELDYKDARNLRVGTLGSVGSGRSLADTGHYGTYDGVDRLGWQRKATAFGNKLDSLASAVNDHPAGLALAQVLLKMGSEVRTGGVVDVVPEFGQEVSAAKHQSCPGE
jgi:hypothetical protein